MKINDILEGKSENRELWDRIKSKGVVPSIDRERYTDMSGEGLEGPFRMKNGQVLYYDPKEGKYYNRDTDMYVDYDDYRAMNEESNKNVSAQIAELIRKKNSVSSPIARKNIDSQIALLKKKRDKTKDVNEMDKSSNDYSGWGHSKHEVNNGPDKTAKMMKAKDAIKAARKTLDKAFDNSKKGVAEGSEIKIPTEDGIGWQDIRLLAGEGKLTQKTIKQAIEIIRKQRKQKQGVAEGDKRPEYVVKASSKPKKIKPSMGGESPHPYQGKLVGATEAEVSNTDYQWTHGKKPKGTGSWFFVAHRGGIDFGKDVEDQDYIQLHGMSYSEAKKAAIKWAKSKGHSSLFVAT